MNAVGDVEVIPESLMNAAGAVSGSGPAYVSIVFVNSNYLFSTNFLLNYNKKRTYTFIVVCTN